MKLDIILLVGFYRQNHPKECFYCGCKLGDRRECEKYPGTNLMTKDHIIPQCDGGARIAQKRNVVSACESCNSKKGRLSLDKFRVVVFEGKRGEFYGEKMYRLNGRRVSRIHKV